MHHDGDGQPEPLAGGMKEGVAVVVVVVVVVAAIVVVLVVLGVLVWANTAPPSASPTTTRPAASSTTVVVAVPSGAVPADMLNPAVTQATIGTTICATGYTATIRPASLTQLKRAQIAAYGYVDTALAGYEEDHVVSLELGGSADARSNLFPEPVAQAKADDQQENVLHAAVCSGAQLLADAQAAVLTLKTSHGYRRATSMT